MQKARNLVLPVAVIIFGLAASAQADDHKYRLNVPADKWLSVSEVIQKLKSQGYQVTKIEADDGVYEFDATNAAGVRIEGHANPATGEVLTGYDD
ncbi:MULTISPECIES: PepSY domain-containing protein [unclassified Hyphomicrobium]|uniref:PepSY domain-containing protein n=1 Tax=unclassified Hyphomicrobium TaxID=2619925 RepID=UPI000213E19E|nr:MULTISPECIES: PepSY domain-containing protein [unclassified Hyphomicrobium]CCB65214.1 putative signal peptide protein [Hyphomicrobium sp. MC1]